MIIFFTTWVQTSFYVKFTYIAALTKTVYRSSACQATTVQYIAWQNSDFQFSVLLRVHQAQAFCARCFLHTCFRHFVMPSLRGYRILVQ
jgi:hypothetical protein